MNRGAHKTHRRVGPALTSVVGSVFVLALGAAYADYAIHWNTIDGGGEMFSTGGVYELSGTIGQPDAGEVTGGTYTLTGGFWFGCAPGDYDCDGDVDLDDYVEFEACLLGPGNGLGLDCEFFDQDGDGDVDLADFRLFQQVYSRP